MTGIPMDEVQDVVTLPDFDADVFMARFHTEEIELEMVIVSQLTDLVRNIGSMYRDNPSTTLSMPGKRRVSQ